MTTTNKQESVSVSFCPSRPIPNSSTSESDVEDDTIPGGEYREWDSFSSVEKGTSAITLGRKGFAKNAEGSYTTKHDPTVCGRRNACRVMDFDVAVKTGTFRILIVMTIIYPNLYLSYFYPSHLPSQ